MSRPEYVDPVKAAIALALAAEDAPPLRAPTRDEVQAMKAARLAPRKPAQADDVEPYTFGDPA